MKKNYSHKRISIRMKTIFGIICISVVLNSIVILLSYANYRDSLLLQRNKELLCVEKFLVSMDSIININELSNKLEVKNEIEKISDSFTDIDVYIFLLKDNSEYLFTGTEEYLDINILTKIKQNNYHNDYLIIKDGNVKKIITGTEIINDENEEVGYLLLTSSIDYIFSRVNDFLILLITAVVEITIVLVILYIVLVNFYIIKPIIKLATATNEFVDYNLRSKNQINGFSNIKHKINDEIGDLYSSVLQMEKDIYEYINEITTYAAENERLATELNVAKKIQESVLPNLDKEFAEKNNFDVYAYMEPAREVGGDFYDSFYISISEIAIVIADVSGKSIPAALFMIIAKNLIKSQLQKKIEPNKVLENVNNYLNENNQANMFVTAFVGIIQLNTGRFIFSNAGHNYPVLIKYGEKGCFLNERHGLVLGIMPDLMYGQGELYLNKGDCILLYTDGVTEAENYQGNLFGEERLMNIINNHSSKEINIKETISDLIQEINHYIQNEMRSDDITILIAQFKGIRIGSEINEQ